MRLLAASLCCVLMQSATGLWGASLQVSSIGDGSLRLTLANETEEFFIIERGVDLSFGQVVAGAISTNLVVTTQGNEFFRARKVDRLAAEYLLESGIVGAGIHVAYSEWVEGLRSKGLLAPIVYMTSLRPDQIETNNTVIRPLVGPPTFCIGLPKWGENGLLFDGSISLEFTDPFQRPTLEELSIFAVFQSDRKSSGVLVGNDQGGGRAGPALWVGGSPYQGIDPENLHFNVTETGAVSQDGGFRYFKTFNLGNTGWPQFGLATANLTNVLIQVNEDRAYQAFSPVPRPIANPEGKWRIGSRGDGSWRFGGGVSFIALFDRRLSVEEFSLLRELYRRTLGQGLPFAKSYVVIEGDSLSAETFGMEYGRFLERQPNWAGRYFKRNISRAGEATRQILEQFTTEALPLRPGNPYLLLWAGRNDLPSWSADQIFERLRQYWRLARGAGYKVAAFTIVPAAYEAQLTEIGAKRKRLNELIRSAGSEYDYLIDVDALPVLSDATNPDYYHEDGVHLTAAAGQEIAALINSIIVLED